jgi:hypothetical protein
VDILNPVNIGIDVGQIQDNTAIAVTEVSQAHDGRWRFGDRIGLHVDAQGQVIQARDADPVLSDTYTVRYIERLPLGTPYPKVAVFIADMLCSNLLYRRRVRVFIDVTGVGRPVYDDLKKEIGLRVEARDAWLKPITFAHGEHYDRNTGRLGKAYLVSRLQSLLQNGSVQAPDTPEVRQTLEELRTYEIKVSEQGKDTYGAFKVGTHDDLATALGLSALESPFADQVRYSRRIAY